MDFLSFVLLTFPAFSSSSSSFFFFFFVLFTTWKLFLNDDKREKRLKKINWKVENKSTERKEGCAWGGGEGGEVGGWGEGGYGDGMRKETIGKYVRIGKERQVSYRNVSFTNQFVSVSFFVSLSSIRNNFSPESKVRPAFRNTPSSPGWHWRANVSRREKFTAPGL